MRPSVGLPLSVRDWIYKKGIAVAGIGGAAPAGKYTVMTMAPAGLPVPYRNAAAGDAVADDIFPADGLAVEVRLHGISYFCTSHRCVAGSGCRAGCPGG